MFAIIEFSQQEKANTQPMCLELSSGCVTFLMQVGHELACDTDDFEVFTNDSIFVIVSDEKIMIMMGRVQETYRIMQYW